MLANTESEVALLAGTEKRLICWWTLYYVPNLLDDAERIKIFIFSSGGEKTAVK